MATKNKKNTTLEKDVGSSGDPNNLRFEQCTLVGGLNFTVWNEQLLQFLSSNNLNGILNDRQMAGTEKDRTCQRILKQACSLSIQNELANCQSALEMWELLKDKYDSNREPIEEAIRLRSELSSCKLTSAAYETVEQWLNKMVSIYSRIVQSNSHFSREEEFLYSLIVKVQEKGDFLQYLNENSEPNSPFNIENIFVMIQNFCADIAEEEDTENLEMANVPNVPKPPVVEFCSLLVADLPNKPSPVSKDCWVILQNTTNHFCGNRNFLTNLRQIDPVVVKGYCGKFIADIVGDVLLENQANDCKYLLTAYYVPGMCTNIIGVGQLERTYGDVRVGFHKSKMIVATQDRKLYLEAIGKPAPHILQNFTSFNFNNQNNPN